VPVIYDDLESREGYLADFLGGGSRIELPKLTDAGKKIVAKLDDGSPELKYHRFSVVMHKKRRLALFTASNVDWRFVRRLVNGRKPTRRELTGLEDGQEEQWVTDPRIPALHQLPDVFYTRDEGAFDKGHLVRRDDVAWGSSFEDIQKGNGDTYHTTNCSPQVAGFNRSDEGRDNWGDLENLVQAQTKAERSIIFAGPVLDPEDSYFHGRDHRGRVSIQIPTKFWKIIVTRGATGPQAYGFVLEQDLSAVPTHDEMSVPPMWERYLAPIDKIEELLGGWATLDALKPLDQVASPEAAALAAELAP
jgi:endonuclease G, mitochondrial